MQLFFPSNRFFRIDAEASKMKALICAGGNWIPSIFSLSLINHIIIAVFIFQNGQHIFIICLHSSSKQSWDLESAYNTNLSNSVDLSQIFFRKILDRCILLFIMSRISWHDHLPKFDMCFCVHASGNPLEFANYFII